MTKVMARRQEYVGRTLPSAAFDLGIFGASKNAPNDSGYWAKRATSKAADRSVRPTHLLFQLLGQQFVHNLRAGLAFGGFHDLADEKAEHGGFSGAVLF